MSLSSVSHVDFKKYPSRHVESSGLGPSDLSCHVRVAVGSVRRVGWRRLGRVSWVGDDGDGGGMESWQAPDRLMVVLWLIQL